MVFMFLMSQSLPLFVYFHSFLNANTNIAQFSTINENSVDGVLGLEPGAAGWMTQTNPLSYGGTPEMLFYFCWKGNR